MAHQAQFAIGAKASCSDGPCGEVRALIIDPATDRLTHLVIRPGHRREHGRLVPLDLVEPTAGGIRLRCTRAEFDKLEHAEERGLEEGASEGGLLGGDALAYDGGRAYAPVGFGEVIDVGPQPVHRRVIVQDVVPLGETPVRPGDRVHAVDGEIGRVQGFLVNPDDQRVTHVLLQEGHLWGRKEVAIPIGAVTGVDDGIRLSITKQQVEDLPPADTDHPG